MTPDDILDFGFPAGLARDLDRHLAFWDWSMRGGADCEILSRFSDLPERAMNGDLKNWAYTPRGRLALIMVLDQFPRSVFRGTAKAYAFDQAALELVQDGMMRGHFAGLETPWERTMYALPLVHAEGPTLRERAAQNVRLAAESLAMAAEILKPAYAFCLTQSRRHKAVLDRFGRHPHRNKTLARASTPDERIYLAQGAFPHQQPINLRRQPCQPI